MSSVPDRPPYESYAAIMGTFAGLLAAAGALGRLLDRDPQCQDALDLVVLGGATFKAARALARDEVTSFDFLQAGFAALKAKANELEEQTL